MTRSFHEIESPFTTNYRVYGARKIWRELNRQGHAVARCTVERLMREMGISGAVRGKRVITTIPDQQADRAPDWVDRNFVAAAPDRCWVADFTHVATWAGVVYVAFVVDTFSRRIVGWSAATSKETQLVLDALEMALWQRDRDERPHIRGELIHHSDAGSQYTSFKLAEHLDAAGIAASIGSVGDAYDKRLSSHCTSSPIEFALRVLPPVAAVEADALLDAGRVGARMRVEAGVLVVVLLALDQSGAVPLPDGRDADVEEYGEFGGGQQAAVAQAVVAVAELVVLADVTDQESVEGASFAAGQAALVEDVGDLGVGVVVEEPVERGDGIGRGLAQPARPSSGSGGGGCGSGRRGAGRGGGCRSVLTRVTSSMSRRTIRLRSRCGVAGSAHRAGKSAARRGPVHALLLGDGVGVGAGVLVVVVGGLQGTERVVPVGLEAVGDEPVVRVDGEVAAAGEVGAVAGAFDVVACAAVGLGGAGVELALGRRGRPPGRAG